jgi:uncharacterized protein YggT (Ycf19 family)
VTLLDFILNLAALSLWVAWRTAKFDPLNQSTPTTLAGTIRRAEPARLKPWHLLLILGLLLLVRAWVYWQIGPLLDWTPSLKLGTVAPPFRSDFFSRSLLYSILSFGSILALFYLWLLLFSMLNHGKGEPGPVQKFVGLQLGFIERWWWPFKVALPFCVLTAFWLGISPFFVGSKIIPPYVSMAHRLEQAATIGLGVYLWWQYLLYAILLLYLLSSYIYLGEHPFLRFVSATGHNLLSPLRVLPLRIAKLDFAPFIAIALIFFLAEFTRQKLTILYSRLPI